MKEKIRQEILRGDTVYIPSAAQDCLVQSGHLSGKEWGGRGVPITWARALGINIVRGDWSPKKWWEAKWSTPNWGAICQRLTGINPWSDDCDDE